MARSHLDQADQTLCLKVDSVLIGISHPPSQIKQIEHSRLCSTCPTFAIILVPPGERGSERIHIPVLDARKWTRIHPREVYSTYAL
jgi:hypothetical protein